MVSLEGLSCLTSTACIAYGFLGSNDTVFSTTDGGQTWQSDSSVPQIGFASDSNQAGGQGDQNTVSCVAPSTCVINGIDAVMFSSDGGQTWQTAKVPASIASISSVSCGSASDCAAVGSTDPVGGPPAAAITSTDGGQTWQAGTLPDGTAYLNAVSCATASQCEAGGAPGGGEAVFPLVASSDGGATWTGQTIAHTVDGFESVSCPTSSRCYAAAYNALLTTTDGGTTWQQLGLPSGVFELVSVSCSSALDCLLTGGVGDVNPTLSLFATTDGGTTWQERTNPFASAPVALSPDASGIVCTPTLDCVAGTATLSSLVPPITVIGADYFSADGGQTWTTLPVNSGGSAGSPNLPFYPGAMSCTSNSSCLVSTFVYGFGNGLTLVTSGGSMSQVLTSPIGGISCPTSTTCFALGGPTFISKSTDAGATWQSLTVPSSVATLSGISCSSASDCAAAASKLSGGFYFPLIITTSDGGQSWQTPAVPSTVSPIAVSCATSTSCEAVGSNGNGGAILGGEIPPRPTTSMLLPSIGATVSGGSQVLDATASSPIGVASVSFEVSGGTLSNQVVATGAPTIYGWVAHWNTTTLPNGTYSLQSVATDVEGASTTSATFTITVNNAAPTTTVIKPANGSTLSGTPGLDAFASAGVTQVQYQLSGGPTNLNDQVVATVTKPSIYGWTGTWNTTTVPNGTYTLQSVAAYPGGVSGTSPPITITVNNAPPTTSVVIPSNNAKVAGTQLLDAGAAAGVSQVQYEVSGGPSNLSDQVVGTATPTLYGWLANWNTTPLTDGTYTLQSVASYAGGVSGTSPPITITVSN